MRILTRLSTALFLVLSSVSYAQTDRCQSDELQDVLMEDSAYARSYFAFEAAIAELQSNTGLRSSLTHVIPVVVHIMHDGAAIGTGSNLSQSQVEGAIDALNADFQGTFGGSDIDVEFVLASRDPQGNPSTGILRTNVAASIPSFSSTGMVTNNNLDPAAELTVKGMSHWPGDDYLNIWVLHKMNGGTSPLGFAYLPPTSGLHDGVAIHHQVFGVGAEYDLLTNFDLNRTLTHEVGHYLGLLHTFNSTTECDAETNCESQGDRVCDTPPTTGSVGCSPWSCEETMVENFMDYSNDACMSSFTEGQRTRMRNALESHRPSLLTSEGSLPVTSIDAGISSVEGISATGCSTTIEPEVLIRNFGTEPLTDASVSFSLNGGVTNVIPWSGNLEYGEQEFLSLPPLSAGTGDHNLQVWTALNGDQYGLNDTIAVEFNIEAGSVLEMEMQLDALPFGITWSVVDVASGTEIMAGGDYDNPTFASVLVTESTCATNGCYELVVEDLFGNGLHYGAGGWYALTDGEGNDLGSASGNFGSEQIHAFCIDGVEMDPCVDANENGICDTAEEATVVPGCTDAESCTYDSEANNDDGSCEYLDALGECGGDCPDDIDGDGICDNAEIPGCTDAQACNYAEEATEDNGGCTYPEAGLDCEGNPLVVVPGCTDAESCTYDPEANTDDGSCQYLDALEECGGDCPEDADGDGICDNAEIPGCTDSAACNYAEEATDDDGGCDYAAEGYDCDGNPLTSSITTHPEYHESIWAYPNPVAVGMEVQLGGLPHAGPWNIRIMDAAGRTWQAGQWQAGYGQNGWTIPLTAPAKAGIHMIRTWDEMGHSATTQRILVH